MQVIDKFKYLYIILSIFLITTIKGQNGFLNLNNTPQWKLYEENISKEEKSRYINEINDDLIVYLKSSNQIDLHFENFHFIDYDLDGITDIIYSGDAGTQSGRTLFFKKRGNEYRKQWDFFGTVESICINIPFDYFGDSYPPFRSIVTHPLRFLFRSIGYHPFRNIVTHPLGFGFDVANVLVF